MTDADIGAKEMRAKSAAEGDWLPLTGVISALFGFILDMLLLQDNAEAPVYILAMLCGDVFLGYMAGRLLRNSIKKRWAGELGIFIETLFMGSFAGWLIGIFNGSLLELLDPINMSHIVIRSGNFGLGLGAFVSFWAGIALVNQSLYANKVREEAHPEECKQSKPGATGE